MFCFFFSVASSKSETRQWKKIFAFFLIVTWEQSKHLLIHVVVSGVQASEQEKYFLIVASIWFHLEKIVAATKAPRKSFPMFRSVAARHSHRRKLWACLWHESSQVAQAHLTITVHKSSQVDSQSLSFRQIDFTDSELKSTARQVIPDRKWKFRLNSKWKKRRQEEARKKTSDDKCSTLM